MAYERQNFKKGQVLTAGLMNSIDVWLEYICGKEITTAAVINGELVFTFHNGETLNAGKVTNDVGGATGNGISDVTLNGDYTLTLEFTDGTSYTTPSLRGPAGEDGEKGDKGDTGKTAYQYARDGGYTGTEAQFADKLAEATPTKLPNPNALTINGTSYDGSKAVTVNIEGGGGSGGGDTVYARITYDAETDETTSTMTAAKMMAAYESGCTVVVVVATSGAVIDVREGSSVLAPYGNNTLLADIITETDKYRVLVECTDPSDPENGRIVVQPFRMGAQPLVGTTDKITPSQVAEAVVEGRPVCISHTDEYGSEYQFTSFNVMDNLVIGEMLMTAGYDTSNTLYATFPHLKGRLGDNERWFFDETLRMATVEGLPTALPNPNKLTINGKSYDGSEEVSVNIEGGSNADWIATSEQVGGAPVFNAVDLPFTGSNYYLFMNNKSFHVNVGVEYDVDWEGTKYVCTPFEASGELFFGNADLQSFESVKEHPLSNKNAPFLFSGSGDTITMVTKNSTTAENIDISVTTHAYTVYNKLPKEYLPDDIGGVNVTAEVGQTIVVEEVDGSGKPTKWRAADYQPRTHWSEIGRGDILPETVFTPTYNSMLGCTTAIIPTFKLEVGKTYTVIFDGVEYTLTAFAGTVLFNFIAVGNTVFAGGANTGEPFAISYLTDTNECVALCMDTNSHTVLVIGEKPLYHTIPKEYVSNGDFCVRICYDVDGYALQTHIDDIIGAIEAGRNLYIVQRFTGTTSDEALDGIPLVIWNYWSPYTFYFANDGTSVCRLVFRKDDSSTNGYIIISRDKNGIVTVTESKWG